MTPEVIGALEEIRHAFPEPRTQARDDGSGGAWVVVDDLPLGPAFTPDRSWVGFSISYLYPRADVYPHFVRPDLARGDGAPLAAPLNPGHSMPGFDRAAVMVSRRSNRWNPAQDTALLKLVRVLHWFTQQASAAERRAA